MSLLTKVRVFAAQIESTSGTAETLTAPDAAFNVFEPVIQFTDSFIPRMSQGSFSHLPGVVGVRAGTVSFRTELYGDGAGGVPAWASTFLPACGWIDATDKFSPSSESTSGSNVKTITVGCFQNGQFRSLRGVALNAEFILDAGDPIGINWTGIGVWNDVTDVAIIAPTYPTVMPLRFGSATWTVGGAATGKIGQLSFNMGNNIILRPDPTKAEGVCAAHITGRRVVGKYDPESRLIATDAPYTDMTNHVEQALIAQVSDGTDTVQFAAPQIQNINVQERDRDGIQVDDIDFQCNASAAAGNDEFTIDFSP